MNKIEGITIRQAQLHDAETILGLMLAAFAEYDGVLDPPSGAHDETIRTVRQKLKRGGAVVAEVDGDPVGVAFYEPVKELLYFSRLSVLPNFRNQGIGAALLEQVETRARHAGAAGVRLGVRLQLPQLVARYERLGYRTTKHMTHKGYADPTYIFMEKRF